jgi:hypothetical protein
VQLTPLNNSGISGTATLSDVGAGRTHVALLVTGSTIAHPAHIHDGSCPNVNPTPKWPLSNVDSGASNTDLDVSLDEILSSPHAIEVHMGSGDLTPAACGDIHS